jgi:predicted RNase H-like nuclease (RuvC/YqgF family)
MSAQLSQFRESGNFTEDPALLSLQEERILQHDREIGALQAELSRQLRLHESFKERIRTEAESASRRANAVEQQVAEVRSEVAKLCKALTEVRQLAEGAQTKTAST